MMLRLGFVLVLCVCGALAYRIDHELEDMDRFTRTYELPTVCKKDIWILWDNSNSLGWKYFNEKIRPFVKSLIESPLLHVGPEGTHIGIISFSTDVKTKVWLGLGDKQNPAEIIDFLYEYDKPKFEDELMGVHTRTGKAFKIADERFPKNNPKNHRPDVGDVVLLFTDGEPRRKRGDDAFGYKYEKAGSTKGERFLADDRAHNLRLRGITVIGLFVGTEYQRREYSKYIKNWVTTPVDEHYYEQALKDDLDSILNDLIGSATNCTEPVKCGCHMNEVAPAYTAHGEKALVTWLEPTLECASGIDPIIKSKVIDPSWIDLSRITPEARFGVGHHKVTYTFGYLSRPKQITKLECPIEVRVKNCKCPSSAPVQAELQPGQTEAQVSWTVPKPNCPTTLMSVSRPGAEGGQDNFPIGDYTITYNYGHTNPIHGYAFILSCPVTISVQGTLCGGIAFDQSAQICCCGKIYDRKANHKCCGYQYYDTGAQTCEEQFTLVDRN